MPVKGSYHSHLPCSEEVRCPIKSVQEGGKGQREGVGQCHLPFPLPLSNLFSLQHFCAPHWGAVGIFRVAQSGLWALGISHCPFKELDLKAIIPAISANSGVGGLLLVLAVKFPACSCKSYRKIPNRPLTVCASTEYDVTNSFSRCLILLWSHRTHLIQKSP